MKEYLEKDEVIHAYKEAYAQGENPLHWIEAIEEADVVEQRHGKWVWDENGMDWGLGAWRCSECGRKPETWWEASQKYAPRRCSGSKYCNHCGAKMD